MFLYLLGVYFLCVYCTLYFWIEIYFSLTKMCILYTIVSKSVLHCWWIQDILSLSLNLSVYISLCLCTSKSVCMSVSFSPILYFCSTFFSFFNFSFIFQLEKDLDENVGQEKFVQWAVDRFRESKTVATSQALMSICTSTLWNTEKWKKGKKPKNGKKKWIMDIVSNDNMHGN